MGLGRLSLIIVLSLIMGILFQNCGMVPGSKRQSSNSDILSQTRNGSTTATNPEEEPPGADPGTTPEHVDIPQDPGEPCNPEAFTCNQVFVPLSTVLQQALCSYLYYQGTTNYYDTCLYHVRLSHDLASTILASSNPIIYDFSYVVDLELATHNGNPQVSYHYANAVNCYQSLLVYQEGTLPPAPRPTVEPSPEQLISAGLAALSANANCSDFIIDQSFLIIDPVGPVDR